MTKKLLSALMASALTLSLVACGDNSESARTETESLNISYEAGTYQGSATGHSGPVTVEVTVTEEDITDIEVVESNESSGLGDVAFDKVSTRVLEGQTLDIDVASGATISSHAFKSAIEDALTEAGANLDALAAVAFEEEVAEAQEIDTEIVVIGSGAAGITAAIEAAENGADVVILEKLSVTGGSTRLSSGMVVVGGSELQAEAGIEDSIDNLKEYWLERGEGNVDEEMVTYVADNANDALDFLMESGISYNSEGVIISGTTETPRAHIPPTFGREFMDKLVERAEAAGVEIYTETKAEELLQNGEEIVGVKATQNGADLIVNAQAVIVATGGYDNNEELKAEYAPDAVGAWAVSAAQNTGDGLVMGMDVGADTVFKNGVIGWKVVSPVYNHTTNIGSPIYGLPELIVDLDGDRFANESEDYPFLFNEMVDNGDEQFYFIFDSAAEETEQIEATTSTVDSLEEAVEAGVAYKADTIEELAELANLTNLPAALEAYNAIPENGEDTEFGRDPNTVTPLEVGPFYALQTQKATLGTFGGLKVNVDSEVLSTDGNAIPGLYAAGEVANGDFFSDIYPASGSAISMSVVFGREAGINASEYVK